MDLSLKFAFGPSDVDWKFVRRSLSSLVRANPQICGGQMPLSTKTRNKKSGYWRSLDSENPRVGRYKAVNTDPEGVLLGMPIQGTSWDADSFLLQATDEVQHAEFVKFEKDDLAKAVLAWLILIDQKVAVTVTLRNFTARVKVDALALAEAAKPDLAKPDWLDLASGTGTADAGSDGEGSINVPSWMDFRA